MNMTDFFKMDISLLLMFIALIILYIFKIYIQSDNFNLTCVIAGKNGNEYCVRKRKDLDNAANLLSDAVDNMSNLVNYMVKKYPSDKRVIRLKKGYQADKVKETLPTSKLTAYSENKGEKIALCLNKSKHNNNRLIDLNTLTFVALHELSHIMTKSIGHKQEFWDNFKLVLENAKEANIYNPVDYKKIPTEYCGMTLSDNPYFDLA